MNVTATTMKKTTAAAVAFTIGLLMAAPAWACPVCFGETEDQVVDGVRWSMVFLGALVYLVIGGGAAMVLVLRRRARRLQDPHRGLYLVDSGSSAG